MNRGVRVAYADEDPARLFVVRAALEGAGCSVTAFPGENERCDGAPPEVVLLSEHLYHDLHALAISLWPCATVVVLSRSDDYVTLAERIKALLS